MFSYSKKIPLTAHLLGALHLVSASTVSGAASVIEQMRREGYFPSDKRRSDPSPNVTKV